MKCEKCTSVLGEIERPGSAPTFLHQEMREGEENGCGAGVVWEDARRGVCPIDTVETCTDTGLCDRFCGEKGKRRE